MGYRCSLSLVTRRSILVLKYLSATAGHEKVWISRREREEGERWWQAKLLEKMRFPFRLRLLTFSLFSALSLPFFFAGFSIETKLQILERRCRAISIKFIVCSVSYSGTAARAVPLRTTMSLVRCFVFRLPSSGIKYVHPHHLLSLASFAMLFIVQRHPRNAIISWFFVSWSYWSLAAAAPSATLSSLLCILQLSYPFLASAHKNICMSLRGTRGKL